MGVFFSLRELKNNNFEINFPALFFFFSSRQGTDNFESYSPNLTKLWQPPRVCSAHTGPGGRIHSSRFDSNAITPEYNVMGFDVPPGARDPTLDNEVDSRSALTGAAARSKVSRRSESLGLSSCSRISVSSVSLLVVVAVWVGKLSC